MALLQGARFVLKKPVGNVHAIIQRSIERHAGAVTPRPQRNIENTAILIMSEIRRKFSRGRENIDGLMRKR